MGERFLQLPIGEVERVDAGRARAGARREPADGRRPDELRPLEASSRTSSSSRTARCSTRRARRACSARRRSRTACRAGSPHGPRLDHGRVLAAARVDGRAHRSARRARGKPGRPHGRDPAADRPRGARASSTSRRSASARSGSTATCSRPTAARAAPRSAGAYVAAARALDRFGLCEGADGSVAAVSVGIVDGAPLLDLDYSEDSTRRRRHERRHDRRRAAGRGAGDGRARPVLRDSSTSSSTSPPAASTSCGGPGRGDRVAAGVTALVATSNRNKLAELEAVLRIGTSRPSTAPGGPPPEGTWTTYEDRRDVSEGPPCAPVRAGRRLGARRGLGCRGAGARRPPGHPVRPLGRRRRRRAARGTCRRIRTETRFVSTIVASRPRATRRRDRDPGRFRGRGAPRSEGFGYDPIFVPLGETRTVVGARGSVEVSEYPPGAGCATARRARVDGPVRRSCVWWWAWTRGRHSPI